MSIHFIHFSENDSILLDCGEGTLNQIRHFYGDKWIKIMKNIKCVFISHFHNDHHQGLYGFLEAKKNLYPNDYPSTILLLPTIDIKSWMSYPCDEHNNILNDNVLLPNYALVRISFVNP